MVQVLGALDFTPLSHDILRRGASRRHSTQAEGRSSDLHLLRSRGYQNILIINTNHFPVPSKQVYKRFT